MTYYVVCPVCGYKLLKAGDGSTIEIYCPKCKGKMFIAVKDGNVCGRRQPPAQWRIVLPRHPVTCNRVWGV